MIRLVSENKKGDSDFRKIAQSAAQIQYDLDQVLNMYKLDAIKNDFHSEKVTCRMLALRIVTKHLPCSY